MFQYLANETWQILASETVNIIVFWRWAYLSQKDDSGCLANIVARQPISLFIL